MLLPGEIVVDNFAGGGGASTGIEAALGRAIDVAVNHDPAAVAMHAANHPHTNHLCQSVWSVHPRDATRDASGKARPIGLAWFSPDCKHFSKAKGGKPVERHIRDLAWVVIRYAALPKLERPRVIMLENVEEFRDWGPLVTTDDGKLMPCPLQKGVTFRRWVARLKSLGYQVDWRELRASDYGAPTIRKRLFLIARCDGLPIVWPKPTHGPKGSGLLPYRTAADCIDWAIPCPSIFERKKPLAENTLKRIARGVKRYVIDAAEPFIVPVTHHGDTRVHPTSEPLRTITTAQRGEMALVVPTVVGCGGRAAQSRPRGGDEPLATMTAKADACLATATLIQTGYGEREGQAPRSLDIEKPLGTVVAGGVKHALVVPHITKFRANSTGHGIDEPMHTVTANSFIKRPGGSAPIGLVSAHLSAYYGEGSGGTDRSASLDDPLRTQTTENRHAVVAAFLAQHNGGYNEGAGRAADDPVSTVTQSGAQQQIVASHLIKLRGTCKDGQPVDDPMPTVTAGGFHIGEVRAFLIKYFGSAEHGQDLLSPLHTATDKARFGLVTVKGEEYQIVDIGMRMLTPRELFRAQGFPDSYIIDRAADGTPITKTAQIGRCGNSVCPPIAEALVRANFAEAGAANDDLAAPGSEVA